MDTVPIALYNPWSAALLGIATALCMLVLAGVALWRSSKSGLQQKLRMILGAIVFGLTGITMLATSTHLCAVQIIFDENVGDGVYGNTPVVSVVALWAQFAVMLVLVSTLVMAITKRMPIGIAGAALLFAVSFTTFADLNMFRDPQHLSSLVVTFGWFLVMITAIAFLVTVATVKIRAYGQRQREAGQKAALNALNPNVTVHRPDMQVHMAPVMMGDGQIGEKVDHISW